MTIGGDFMPNEGEEEVVGYPKLFGLTITPVIGAIALTLLGALAAYLLWSNLVQGTLTRNQELKTDIEAKEAQLANQADTQKQIAEAKVRLQSAKQLQADVRSLFATEDSLNTLLLDVNERVQSVNAGITDPARRASLAQFDLNTEASGVISDSSLGTEVNGKLERRVYDVQIKGSFPQTQSIIRNIERLQPLLVVSDLVSDLDSETQKILLDDRGRITPTGQPNTQIITSFKLSALLPADPNQPAPATP
ncbi:MAG: pilus assembly protein PilO [Pegethrix bostrychoides GSE-TBD4-15B]|jgi:type IV pilus assembly protein PilO|uniref:Pilus assembly protein PilO n=1 Tax=Pegethrix bostrychoides GSE-TBD4-15B TaxID=2839662 RepID=A0A951PF10_9CYAN|nr:pilus assembly protein PilO [Pegethrix bostrychoides GSE-TBD4-15B]